MTSSIGRLVRVLKRWFRPIESAQGVSAWVQRLSALAVIVFGPGIEVAIELRPIGIPHGYPSVIVFLVGVLALALLGSYRQEFELERLTSRGIPRLRFGEPKSYPRELTDLVRYRQLEPGLVEELPGPFGIRWCRVALTNEAPGTVATSVRVWLSSEPQLDFFPVEVREKHNISPPYSIRCGETIEFDVVGHGDDSRWYLARCSNRRPGGFVHAIEGTRVTTSRFVLKLSAVPDPPGQGDGRDYELGGYALLQELVPETA